MDPYFIDFFLLLLVQVCHRCLRTIAARQMGVFAAVLPQSKLQSLEDTKRDRNAYWNMARLLNRMATGTSESCKARLLVLGVERAQANASSNIDVGM